MRDIMEGWTRMEDFASVGNGYAFGRETRCCSLKFCLERTWITGIVDAILKKKSVFILMWKRNGGEVGTGSKEVYISQETVVLADLSHVPHLVVKSTLFATLSIHILIYPRPR